MTLEQKSQLSALLILAKSEFIRYDDVRDTLKKNGIINANQTFTNLAALECFDMVEDGVNYRENSIYFFSSSKS